MTEEKEEIFYTEFPFLTLEQVKRLKPMIELYDVSKVARSRTGFLYNYLNGTLTLELLKKREAFLNRALAAYDKDPSIRRYLSIIAWSYDPYNIKKPNGLTFDD